MFDSGVELPALSTAGLAGLIEQNHAELMARECRTLQLACAWADAHYLDSGSDEYQPLIQRACAWGGEGTPEVTEYCAAELGALHGTGIMAARALIADALDLRYRLPRLWASGAHRRSTRLASPQNRRTHPTLVVGSLRRHRPRPQRPGRNDALAAVRHNLVRNHPPSRPGTRRGTGRGRPAPPKTCTASTQTTD